MLSVAWIQETKWFGCDVWITNGHTLCTPQGWPLLYDSGRAKGLELKKTIAVWKEDREVWGTLRSQNAIARLISPGILNFSNIIMKP